jgi:hypothetical protein
MGIRYLERLREKKWLRSYPASHFQNRACLLSFSRNMRRTYEEERETRLPREAESEKGYLAKLFLHEQ